MLWSDIQAACEEADFLYEETGKHHAVIQVGSMMMVVEHNSMLRHMYSTISKEETQSLTSRQKDHGIHQ
jgi:hypothetical protein